MRHITDVLQGGCADAAPHGTEGRVVGFVVYVQVCWDLGCVRGAGYVAAEHAASRCRTDWSHPLAGSAGRFARGGGDDKREGAPAFVLDTVHDLKQ